MTLHQKGGPRYIGGFKDERRPRLFSSEIEPDTTVKPNHRDVISGTVLGVVALGYLALKDIESTGTLSTLLAVVGCLAGVASGALVQRARSTSNRKLLLLSLLLSPLPALVALPVLWSLAGAPFSATAYVLGGLAGALWTPLLLIFSRE